jgi:hypothetical protein
MYNNMIARRLVVGYVTLVGVPLLAVLLILRLGEDLQAPPSIDGSWVMARQVPSQAAGGCSEFLGQFAGRTLILSQSGRYIAGAWDHLPDRKMRGRLEGNEFLLSSEGDPQGACDKAPLRIEGSVSAAAPEHALQARLVAPACEACGEVKLVSVSHSPRSAAALLRGF